MIKHINQYEVNITEQCYRSNGQGSDKNESPGQMKCGDTYEEFLFVKTF
jgi:hypothetical protein